MPWQLRCQFWDKKNPKKKKKMSILVLPTSFLWIQMLALSVIVFPFFVSPWPQVFVLVILKSFSACLLKWIPIFLVPHAAHFFNSFFQKPIFHGSVALNPGFTFDSLGSFYRLPMRDPSPETQMAWGPDLVGFKSSQVLLSTGRVEDHWQRTF